MPSVVLPSQLARRAGADRLEVATGSAAQALRELERSQPALKGWVLDERGRLREHVSLFVNSRRADLDAPLAAGDELFVVQAISGGAPEAEVLVGTRKGLFVLRGSRGSWEVAHREFPGETVEYATRDPRSGRLFASVTHGQFGPRLFHAERSDGEWTQAEGPAFPEGADAAVDRIWVVTPGVEDGVLWAGVAPAALFRSADGGATWRLVEALWNHPTRPEWQGGFGGLCLHSICPHPGEPGTIAVAISSVGVWISEDGGASWRNFHAGLVPRYLPEEARADTLVHCVHNLQRSPAEPETMYLQFHGGVYRSDDGGRHWIDIAGVGTDRGLPADFGFPMVVDPRDPARALVIPLIADVDRVTPDGRLRVYETRDRGGSWRALSEGLPQENAWVTVLRQAFCHDGGDPLGLYFGTEQGTLWASSDDGRAWRAAAENLPPIVAVRAFRRDGS
jgi:molybdopterin converting factor small subunit